MVKILKLLRWVSIVVIFLTFLSYLSPHVSPLIFWPISFFGLAYPLLLAINILLVLVWLPLKDRYALYSIGCILVGWGQFDSFVGTSFSAAKRAEKNAITVMTYNCHSIKNRLNRNTRYGPPELGAVLEPGVQVLCLQEFTAHDFIFEKFAAYLREEKGLSYSSWEPEGELAIFSAFPLHKKRTKYFGNESNGYQFADMDMGQQTVRVFNIHLQSNSISGIADKMAEGGDLKEKETWLGIKGMMGRYKRAAQKRARQAEEISRYIDLSPHPALVCGDFNDVPQSYSYKILSHDLKDAFKKKGRGLGITFAGAIPALRIDYILSDPGFKVLDHRIGRTKMSDHFPVSSRLEWAPSQ